MGGNQHDLDHRSFPDGTERKGKKAEGTHHTDSGKMVTGEPSGRLGEMIGSVVRLRRRSQDFLDPGDQVLQVLPRRFIAAP